jgi:hypothetical protein
MDSINANQASFSQIQRFEAKGDKEKTPDVKEVFEKSSGEEGSPMEQASALKRMAEAIRKNEIKSVEGNRSGSVEEFSDLTLNGPGSKEILYLGV